MVHRVVILNLAVLVSMELEVKVGLDRLATNMAATAIFSCPKPHSIILICTQITALLNLPQDLIYICKLCF
jgi:hypothetical protein